MDIDINEYVGFIESEHTQRLNEATRKVAELSCRISAAYRRIAELEAELNDGEKSDASGR